VSKHCPEMVGGLDSALKIAHACRPSNSELDWFTFSCSVAEQAAKFKGNCSLKQDSLIVGKK